MPIVYIPDHEFHASIDQRLAEEGATGADNYEERDAFITETRLAIEGVWPESWRSLMSDGNKASLIRKIIAERSARSA